MGRSSAIAIALLSASAGLSSAPALAAGSWQGFYAGGGITLQRWGVGLPYAANTLTIDDSSTVGIDFTAPSTRHWEGDSPVGGHVLIGYLRQRNQWVFGLEGDYEFGSGYFKSVLPSTTAPFGTGVAQCANPVIPVIGYFACVGPDFYFGEVETQGHVRALLGVAATPTFMGFFAAGVAIGRSPEYISAQDGGIVAHSPSAPLVGLARVTRSGIAKTMYGYTVGGGFEVKASPNLRMRAEYLYDRYNPINVAVGGAGFGGTIGTVTTNSFAGVGNTIDMDSHSIRVSAIYQFTPRGAKAEPWPQIVSDWTGPYAGVGLTIQQNRVAFPHQVNNATIDNTTTAGIVEFTGDPSLDHAGNTVGGALLVGYSRQRNRWVFGAEGDYDFRNGFKVDRPPGMPPCINPAVMYAGAFSCVAGGSFFSDFQTLGHVRATVGFAVTPTLMGFLAGGVAIGHSPSTVGVAGGGFVASSPSAPLIGAAAVTRNNMGKTIYGGSVGAGVQVMMDQRLRLRAEYMFDWYQPMSIAVGGVGFGGTIGDTQVNSFFSVGNQMKLASETVRLSLIYQY